MKVRLALACVLAVLAAATLPAAAGAGMHDGHGKTEFVRGHGFGMHDGNG